MFRLIFSSPTNLSNLRSSSCPNWEHSWKSIFQINCLFECILPYFWCVYKTAKQCRKSLYRVSDSLSTKTFAECQEHGNNFTEDSCSQSHLLRLYGKQDKILRPRSFHWFLVWECMQNTRLCISRRLGFIIQISMYTDLSMKKLWLLTCLERQSKIDFINQLCSVCKVINLERTRCGFTYCLVAPNDSGGKIKNPKTEKSWRNKRIFRMQSWYFAGHR